MRRKVYGSVCVCVCLLPGIQRLVWRNHHEKPLWFQSTNKVYVYIPRFDFTLQTRYVYIPRFVCIHTSFVDWNRSGFSWWFLQVYVYIPRFDFTLQTRYVYIPRFVCIHTSFVDWNRSGFSWWFLQTKPWIFLKTHACWKLMATFADHLGFFFASWRTLDVPKRQRWLLFD